MNNPKISSRIYILLISLFLTTSPVYAQGEVGDDLIHDGEVSDPLETINRGIFAFNDTLDIYFLEPVAKGYDKITPRFVQTGIKNFFENLNYPKYLLSDLIQFKFTQVGTHTGRFLMNSTIGVGGLFDVAEKVGLEKHFEDTAVALAYRGIPNGPYLVLPLFGPSTLRDAIGLVGDSFINPLNLLFYSSLDQDIVLPVSLSLQALDIVQTRAGLIDAIRAAKESSLDYYTFAQSSYIQYRQGLLNDSEGASKD